MNEAPARKLRVFVAGGTGYIGKHVVRALGARGHDVVCLARKASGVGGASSEADTKAALAGAEVRFGDATDAGSVLRDGFRGERFDAVISCLATRTGAPADAWAIEHRANANVLVAAKEAGATRFVLLSAICVQKPRLAFQHAKLAFEAELRESGLDYSIVRPTAFFKSLAGQVEAVKSGKPFLVFGDGRLTSCKPISERDLARFIVDCLDHEDKRNKILPIGGPGAPITPREQGAMLAKLCGRAPRYRQVPVRLMDAVIFALAALGRVFSKMRDKAELAGIGRYYATESMLVWDPAREAYDADATPSYGEDTLEAFYANAVAHGLRGQELGDHAVFARPRARAAKAE